MIIDSHAHLDFPAFVPDREMVLARARQQEVAAIITVGINMAANRLSLALAGAHAGVYAAVGVHPNEAGRMPDDDWGGLAEMAAGARVVAIGETGLDFYRRGASPEQQMAAFRRQLDLAAELGRPVIIHGRQADKEVLETLTSWVAATPAPADGGGRGVIHCFGGDLELARRYFALGFSVSFTATITYPSARKLAGVLAEIPLDRFLVETDCPFLPPQPYRGQRNEPSYVPLVAGRIAEIKGIPVAEVARATVRNTINLFRLPILAG